ncbi:metallophosphoesterase [Rubrobacter marinus]|uniref:Metallophosphoesterase n=1 Tax=Rubrobacter marinus TaxID=2653852 RepID=A0A6G8Q024_9ACTN|nr:TIGR00282 family metallophosphoesterase [Rubrobacter marinus]QIN79812.1 metallophosphoesterase [Rubrobacter marinus]
MSFRLLFVGDVVGEAGIEAVTGIVPGLREGLGLDAVVVNGENSAPGGRGITEGGSDALLSVADFLTLGNHAFDADGKFLEREPRAVRPANLRSGQPGRGWGTFEAGGARVGVVNVMGRVFLDEGLPSPFEAADRAVESLEGEGADLILVDVHAEATSEKQAMGFHLDGRAQVVVGTHTHVPTADDRVLPGGTAYASDVGMTGREGSVIGFDRGDFMALFVGRPRRIGIATEGPVIFRAVVVDLDVEGRRATGIERLTREWPVP